MRGGGRYPPARGCHDPGGGARARDKPETFDFLGFTHYWGKSRAGHQVVKEQTARGRFARALRAIKERGLKHRHEPLKEQQCKLNEKLCGHDACHGVTGNHRVLHGLRWEEAGRWGKWIAGRNRGNEPNWQQFGAMLQSFPLTPARVIRSQM